MKNPLFERRPERSRKCIGQAREHTVVVNHLQRFLALAMLLMTVRILHAQEDWQYRGEVFGVVGSGRFYNGEHKWGSGLQFGGGFGFRPFPRVLRQLGMEARIHHLNFDGPTSPTRSTTGKASSVAVGVLWHLSNSAVQPYLLGEFGGMRTSFTRKGVSDWYEANPDGSLGQHHVESWVQQDTASQFLWGVGIGLKIRLTRQFYARPELRFDTTTVGQGWNFETLRFSAGCGYHW